ncbi:uncharacterized protein LOC124982575 isoform X2 [Sciurus carolinensis]|uniref:uncharacterized protein LOC124982575 isoform X2 n=1 Tax=Sciurus carolinensis TaxID=30640 RepID=UPI001FB45B95|nr:uncharacterized protein LOC124982575 isoform X2 [Sciurus carolinensis]
MRGPGGRPSSLGVSAEASCNPRAWTGSAVTGGRQGCLRDLLVGSQLLQAPDEEEDVDVWTWPGQLHLPALDARLQSERSLPGMRGARPDGRWTHLDAGRAGSWCDNRSLHRCSQERPHHPSGAATSRGRSRPSPPRAGGETKALQLCQHPG